MTLKIATNVQSLAAQRSLREVKHNQSKAFQKLSSGNRINKASDDAAGLAISEQLRSKIRSSRQATSNANNGIAIIQTAEGGLNEVSNILIRLRELSMQAASDTMGDEERAFSDMEFQQLKMEIERIAESTTFSERKLLTGEGDSLDFQVGISNSPNYDRITYNPQDNSARVSDLDISSLQVDSKEDAQKNLNRIDKAITIISSNRATLGALQSRLQSTINNLEVSTENLARTNSNIRDADVAAETANLARANVLEASNLSVLAQANTSTSSALRLIGQ